MIIELLFDLCKEAMMLTVLRLARLKTRATLRSFARLHQLDEATLSRIERGIQYVPPHWRQRLAIALELGVDDICDARGWPKLVE